MPRHNGNAIRKTRNPDKTSARQLSASPDKPVFGGEDSQAGIEMVIVCDPLKKTLMARGGKATSHGSWRRFSKLAKPQALAAKAGS